jgi:hypothetical protein
VRRLEVPARSLEEAAKDVQPAAQDRYLRVGSEAAGSQVDMSCFLGIIKPWREAGYPKFNDTYRGYYIFMEEVVAYITDYSIVYTGRRVAGLIKQYCLSSNTKVLVGQANSSQLASSVSMQLPGGSEPNPASASATGPLTQHISYWGKLPVLVAAQFADSPQH